MHRIEIDPVMLARGRRNRDNKDFAFTSLDMPKVALVVIDMQSAYLSPGSCAEVPIAREIVSNINALSNAVRAAGGVNVFVRKTYDPSEKHSWSNWYGSLLGSPFSSELASALTPGTPSHELWHELDISPQDLIVNKTRFSAFTHGTCDLDSLLREREIDTVIVTGTLTNFCSESTARDANQLNYRVFFVSDGNAALTDEEHNTTLGTLYAAYADVVSTDRLLKLISQSQPTRASA